MRIQLLYMVVFGHSLIDRVLAGGFLEKKTTLTVAAPNCSLTCLGTLIPQYCDSLTDVSCICTNTELAAALTPCALAACNVTESLQLAKYNAESCGVENDKTYYWLQIRTYAVLMPLVVIFVALRILSRITLKIGLGPDDYVILLALTFYLAMTSTAWTIAVTGFGQHTFWLLPSQVIKALKFFYISELLYLTAITLTKLSLLLFFRRIFPSRGFRTATFCVGAFILASNIALITALALQCTPVHGNWTNWMYKSPPVKCINVFAAVYSAAGFSVTHDVIILLMPLPTLWGLNLALGKKLNLLVMFGVGSFVVVASVIRLPSLMKMGSSSDPSYDQAPVAFWTNVEVSVGIICACLPACRSLLGYIFPRLRMSLNNDSSNGRRTPGYVNTPSTTNEYFKKKRAARDSFLELDDQSKTGSQEELKGKKSKTQATTTSKKSFQEDNDGDSITHIQTNHLGNVNEERFVPSERKGFGHMVNVVVEKPGMPNSYKGGKKGEIFMTTTLDQSTTSRF